MAELFDMGAVSAVQRDAARRAYESALAESSTPSYEYSAAPEPIIEYYTEYVDEFRETPAEVLAGAEQAIKQAELSLNIARQEARETDVIAPVSGAIYYGVEIENELDAGESVAKIGDSRELWLEVEVTEEIFDKIPLGKLVTYTLDGRELFGTVIEKIRPNVNAPAQENSEPIELPEIPTSENAPAQLIGENPSTEIPSAETSPAEIPPVETPPAEVQTQPAENNPSAEKIRSVIDSFRKNPQIVEAETQILENDDVNLKIRSVIDSVKNKNQSSAENPSAENPPAENPPAENSSVENSAPQPPKIPDSFENQQKPNDKFIIKISLPAERDFECRPNTKTTVKIKI